YPNVGAANETKKLLDRLFPLRKCKVLPKEVCLYYHMHQCLAPCVFQIDPEVYEKMVQAIRRFLGGDYQEIRQEIVEKMTQAAEDLQFEKAAEYRDQVKAIDTIMTRQKMTQTDFVNRDVFGYYVERGWLCVQVFFVRQGKLIQRDVTSFPIYDEPEESFLTFIGQFYQKAEHIIPNEILIPEEID